MQDKDTPVEPIASSILLSPRMKGSSVPSVSHDDMGRLFARPPTANRRLSAEYTFRSNTSALRSSSSQDEYSDDLPLSPRVLNSSPRDDIGDWPVPLTSRSFQSSDISRSISKPTAIGSSRRNSQDLPKLSRRLPYSHITMAPRSAPILSSNEIPIPLVVPLQGLRSATRTRPMIEEEWEPTAAPARPKEKGSADVIDINEIQGLDPINSRYPNLVPLIATAQIHNHLRARRLASIN